MADHKVDEDDIGSVDDDDPVDRADHVDRDDDVVVVRSAHTIKSVQHCYHGSIVYRNVNL